MPELEKRITVLLGLIYVDSVASGEHEKAGLGGVDVRNQIHPYIQRNKCHASLFKQVRMTFSLKDSQPPPFEDSHAGSITCKIS